MSEPCEDVRGLASAESSCPLIETVAAAATAALVAGVATVYLEPALTTDAATASSFASGTKHTLTTDVGLARSGYATSVNTSGTAASSARAVSGVITGRVDTVVDTATATSDALADDAAVLAFDLAEANSYAVVGVTASALLEDSALAQGLTDFGHLEVTTDTGVALDAALPSRGAFWTATSDATASADVVGSSDADISLYISRARASSDMFTQTTSSALLTSGANATSDVLYRDPERVAWVMNTETTSMSQYKGFDFNSIAQVRGQVLAVGPDGLYELVGDTDDGAPIAAELVGGFTDFRRPHQKRLDSMYFGYTSEGVLSVTPEVLESGYPPIEYELEQRSATAPRNTRVRPGKGLFGRYWRVTFRNKDGTSFTVHDITADIAVSARRL